MKYQTKVMGLENLIPLKLQELKVLGIHKQTV